MHKPDVQGRGLYLRLLLALNRVLQRHPHGGGGRAPQQADIGGLHLESGGGKSLHVVKPEAVGGFLIGERRGQERLQVSSFNGRRSPGQQVADGWLGFGETQRGDADDLAHGV